MWKPLLVTFFFVVCIPSVSGGARGCLSALRANAQTEFECQSYADESFSFGTFLLFRKDENFKSSPVSDTVTGMLEDSRFFRNRSRGFESFPPEAKALVDLAQGILEFAFPRVLGIPFPLDARKTVLITPEQVMQADRIAMKAIIDQNLVHRSPMEFLRAVVHENVHLAGRADEVLLEYDALPLLESITEWVTLRCFDVASAAGIGVPSNAFRGSAKYREWVKSLETALPLLTPTDPEALLKLVYVTGNPEPLRTRLRAGFQVLAPEARSHALTIYLEMLRGFAGPSKR